MLKIDVLHRFSIPLDRFLPKTLPRCVACADRQSVKWLKNCLMVPIIVYFASFGAPSGSKTDDLCTDGQKRASFAPQKCKPKAQSKAGEPSGFAHRLCFESMAIVFAIDVACLLDSTCLAHSSSAVSIEFKAI